MPELESTGPLRFQRRTWRFERVGWVVLALILAAAAVGALGAGPLSRATARSADGRLEIDYERIARHRRSEALQVRVVPAAGQEEVRLSLPTSYLAGVRTESVYPEPDAVDVGPERVVYTFTLAAPGARATITFRLVHEDDGVETIDVQLGDADRVRVRQLVLP